MKSFCTKLFFKKIFFPKFWSIEHVFRSIEIVIKIFGQPLFVSIDSRLILDQSKHFQSIEPNFRSIENCIESFLKSWFSHVQLTIQKVFKHTQTLSLSLSLFDRLRLQSIFLSCSSNSFARFSPLRPVRLFYPSFCIYFQVSFIFHAFFGEILNL